MDARDRRARHIQEQIAAILFRDWDPIGVRDTPETRGEYDAYVGGVYRLLASGASAAEIERHLREVERTEMGMSGTINRSAVAEKLAALDVRLSSN